MQGKKSLKGSSQSQSVVSVEDVFNVNVRTGTGAATNVVTGIDGVENDVMVWLKCRSLAKWHWLVDTQRGSGTTYPAIHSNSTQAEGNTGRITSINADGFSLGTDSEINGSGETYVDYTFKKSPRFFDMVKYTGNGVAGREIAHDLGCDVGFIIIKPLGSGNWTCYHKGISVANRKAIYLDKTNEATTEFTTFWNDTHPTDAVFTLGDFAGSNANGAEYIAYLFAHSPVAD